MMIIMMVINYDGDNYDVDNYDGDNYDGVVDYGDDKNDTVDCDYNVNNDNKV